MNENNVQFDMDQKGVSASQTIMNQSRVPGMAAWLVRKGIIKNESSAKSALIGIVFTDFIIAAIIIYLFVLR